MDMMELNIPLFGMVKDDKHRTRALLSEDGEVDINPMTPVFKMITNIQDEVHNTAISYHRKLHGKFESELDMIKGVGEARRNKVIKHFGDIESVKKATLAELEECVDKSTAKSIYEYFHS